MKYLKLFEEYAGHRPFGILDVDQILSNIDFVESPRNWKELYDSSIDLDDIDEKTLKSLFKLPVYEVTDLDEIFYRNPANMPRVSMPYIPEDIIDDNTGEVIQFATQYYASEEAEIKAYGLKKV
jgi:hypothetical protein